MDPSPIVLILPAHDEAATVGAVVRRAPTAALGHRVEVLVVDDGSRDSTAAQARDAGATVVSHHANRGLGAAIRTGIAAALTRSPAAVAFCDADGEYSPEELPRLVAPILAGEADYVVGSRFAGHIRSMLWHRRLGNHLLTRIVRRLTSAAVTDGQSGYRALSASAARHTEIAHDYNYAQVLTMELLASGMRYGEVPITYSRRQKGTSFVRPVAYARRVVPTAWRLHRRLRAGSRPARLGPAAATDRAAGVPAA